MDERDELDEVLERAHASALSAKRRAYGKDLITRARAIRDRERKLAGLAREMGAMLLGANRVGCGQLRIDAGAPVDWLKRYEEAVK